MKESNHEISYRSEKIFKKMRTAKICVCGAGALGSNLVNNLTRQGFEKVSVIDMDRVEKHNIATQAYSMRDVGQKKAKALKGLVFNNTGRVITAVDKELRKNNADKLLRGHDVVVDVFDNWKSRSIVKETSADLLTPVIHAGMSDDGFAEVKWGNYYNIPTKQVEQEDVCDYPLAANLVHMTVAVLEEAIVQYVADEKFLNREITLKDLKIHSIG